MRPGPQPPDTAAGSPPAPPVPAIVSLHVWGVPRRHVPTAVARMALHRRAVRALPGVKFAKLLGTGSGRTFTPGDADAEHWGVLACWADEEGPARFAASRVARAWERTATESATWLMRPLSSRGHWAGQEPFGRPVPSRWDGPVAAITRARLKPRLMRQFWASVPPVALDVHQGGGMTFALGIGEAPIGLQGTFSTWADGAALSDFAHRRAPHQRVVALTAEKGWYAEELFARLALLDVAGRYRGRPL